MPYSVAGKNKMLDALGITHVQGYNGDPAGAGTSVGARVAISFNAAAAGSADQAPASVLVPVNAGATINYLAYWDAASGGNLLGTDPITAEVFAGAGNYELTETTLTITD